MYQSAGDKLAQAAQVLAVFSIAMMLFFPVLLPYIPAGIAIVMAVISKGSDAKLSRKGRIALILGIIAIVASTARLVFSIVNLIEIAHDPERLEQMNELLYRMYGMSLQELLEQAGLDQLGIF